MILTRVAAITTVAALLFVATLAVPVARVSAGSTRIDNLIASMSTQEKVGQLFMVSFYGDEAADTDAGPVRFDARSGRALVGELNPAAKLPVTIPTTADPDTALYGFGHGLSYS